MPAAGPRRLDGRAHVRRLAANGEARRWPECPTSSTTYRPMRLRPERPSPRNTSSSTPWAATRCGHHGRPAGSRSVGLDARLVGDAQGQQPIPDPGGDVLPIREDAKVRFHESTTSPGENLDALQCARKVSHRDVTNQAHRRIVASFTGIRLSSGSSIRMPAGSTGPRSARPGLPPAPLPRLLEPGCTRPGRRHRALSPSLVR